MASACLIVFTSCLDSEAADETTALNEYLIVLHRSNAEFAGVLRRSGVEPLRHSGARWLVRMAKTQVIQIEQLTEVEQVFPAAGLVLTLDPSVADLSPQIEALGGIVVQRYENLPLLSVSVPLSRLSQVQRLRGVKRVSKQRTFVASKRP
jgi:hypothetical protein